MPTKAQTTNIDERFDPDDPKHEEPGRHRPDTEREPDGGDGDIEYKVARDDDRRIERDDDGEELDETDIVEEMSLDEYELEHRGEGPDA